MTPVEGIRRVDRLIPGVSALWRLTTETVRVCLRYRVTGLAAEAGFFALMALPPLLLGLFGGLGYLGTWLGQARVEAVSRQVQTWGETFLTDEIIGDLIVPTVEDVFREGRFDLISVGFLLSLWSGSRALNVLIDTVSIMYGQSGERGIVRARALSFSLYFVGLVIGVVVLPLLLLGPGLVDQLVPQRLDFVVGFYWPVVSVVVVASLAGLFHIAKPRRTAWRRDLPGALLTLVIWALSSVVVREVIAVSLDGTSIYGPLSAPIVLMIWLYAIAIALLIGAALNAAIQELWPLADGPGLRVRTKRALSRTWGL